VDIVAELKSYGIEVDIVDPWCSADAAEHEYGLNVRKNAKDSTYDGIIIAVGHQEFKDMGVNSIRKLGKVKHILFDLKYVLDKFDVDIRL
jgi:UDP-N-acetyl-D-galactosamine dehydrogenase